MMLQVKQMENRKLILPFDESIEEKVSILQGVLGKTILYTSNSTCLIS